jgi:hypothetical protein
VTNAPPAAIQTLIDAHIKGINTHDHELFLSVFGDTAIIIEGIARYRWLNPNAPGNWLADVAKWRETLGVTAEHLSYEMGFGTSRVRPPMWSLPAPSRSRFRERTSSGPALSHTRSQGAMASGRLRHKRGGAHRIGIRLHVVTRATVGREGSPAAQRRSRGPRNQLAQDQPHHCVAFLR